MIALVAAVRRTPVPRVTLSTRSATKTGLRVIEAPSILRSISTNQRLCKLSGTAIPSTLSWRSERFRLLTRFRVPPELATVYVFPDSKPAVAARSALEVTRSDLRNLAIA
jgi:hypothetical protein